METVWSVECGVWSVELRCPFGTIKIMWGRQSSLHSVGGGIPDAPCGDTACARGVKDASPCGKYLLALEYHSLYHCVSNEDKEMIHSSTKWIPQLHSPHSKLHSPKLHTEKKDAVVSRILFANICLSLFSFIPEGDTFILHSAFCILHSIKGAAPGP